MNENIAARRKLGCSNRKTADSELASYNNWVAMLDAVPLIRLTAGKVTSYSSTDAGKYTAQNARFNRAGNKGFAKHAKSIIHQILEEPIKQEVKSMGKSEKDLKMFQTIFGLDHKRS